MNIDRSDTQFLRRLTRTLSARLLKVLPDGGIEVLVINGLEVTKSVERVKLPDYATYKVARDR